jgi:probable F420-dependent oxidoreductase
VKPFRFAVQAVPRGTRREWQDLARRVEALGYSTLQVPDHLGIVDPFTPLVSAADVTTTLRVGQLVINNALHHPVLLARQAATVDLLTDGRLELGLGTGWAQAEHDASGIPLPAPPERVDQFEEALEIVASLLETGAARSDGAYRVAVDNLGVRGVQTPRPPILIGGFRQRVLAIAARHAEIVQLTGLALDGHGGVRFGDASRATAVTQAREVTATAGGRDPELSVFVQRIDVDDPKAAIAATSDRLGLPPEVVEESPYFGYASVDALVERLVALREESGLSYYTVHEVDEFSPVVARLAGT